jgi:subtilisin family serine protease
LVGVLATAGSAWALRPNDDNWALQWPQAKVSMSQAWNLTRGNRHVIVAVVDTGINPRIKDFKGALVPGRDFVSGGYTKVDTEGHGTLLASIIAARGNNAWGVPGYCWRCRLMPIRVAAGQSINTSVAAQGIRWAADHGARIITISFSETPGSSSDPSVAAAIAYAAQKGVLVLTSAGNTAGTGYTYPAADPGAYAVAGTSKFDQLSSWSTRGSWIHLAAPGCQLALSAKGDGVEPCGSSVSAPAVAGIAALMLSVNPSLSSTQIISILEHTAKPVTGIAGGRVNANAAIRAAAAKAVLNADAKPVLLQRFLRGGWNLGLAVHGERVAATLHLANARSCSLSLAAPDAVWLTSRRGRNSDSLVARVSTGKYRLNVSCRMRRPRLVSLSMRAFAH